MHETAADAPAPFSRTEVQHFERDGFIVVPGLAETSLCERMRRLTEASLSPPMAPLEFEADVRYPGGPDSRSAAGGDTPRRLLHAYTRDAVFRDWALGPALTGRVAQLLGTPHIALSQNHHNCIMTKHPGFSSATHWHQDIRYWSFDRPELVSVWLALGRETPNNGCLRIIAGSHRLDIDRGRLDAELFLREDLEENQPLIAGAGDVELAPGDVLFFSARVFHYAGQNHSRSPKLSLVFTYRAADNQPIPDTRSARFPDIEVDATGSYPR